MGIDIWRHLSADDVFIEESFPLHLLPHLLPIPKTSWLCKVESDEKLKPLVAVIEFVTWASYLLCAINKS